MTKGVTAMCMLHFYRSVAMVLLAMVAIDPTFAQEAGPKAKVYQPVVPQILDTNMRALPPKSPVMARGRSGPHGRGSQGRDNRAGARARCTAGLRDDHYNAGRRR